MLLQRINRSDPEKIFIIAKNTYGTASLTNGMAVIWDYVTDQDGVGVTKAGAGTAKHGGAPCAGVAAETIAAGSYGMIQVYGVHSAVRGHAGTGGLAAATGIPLALVDAEFAVGAIDVSVASTAVVRIWYPMGFSMGLATSLFTTTTGKVFIKCLG